MSRNSYFLCSLSLLILHSLSAPAFAQTPAPETTSPTPTSTSSRAADLTIAPRFGAGYNTSGGGFDGYGRIEGFIPLSQTAGRNVLFLDGKLLLDNNSNIGSNLLLGYRALNQQGNVLGGYLGFDTRDTGKSSFNQLGFGLELLSQNWDLRLNSYIPVGTTRNQIGEDNRTEFSTPYFQTNYLLADRTVVNNRYYQAAMTGVDLMAGTKLANLGTMGELRGTGGLYYYSAAGSESTLGVKLGLTARPNDSLNFGVGLQSDGIFGTNLLFSIGASFPSSRPRGVAPNTVLARMGESVERVNTIAVRNQAELSETTTIGEQLTNPTTGQPYYFYHVALGNGSNGSGTFESPYNSLPDALDATKSDGNEIVYLQGNQEVQPFTIPDGVQVRSTGPIQQLVTTQIASATLPLSGSTQYPFIDGGGGTGGQVIMGNNTLLAGFRLVNADNQAVEATNVQNVTIQDNIIQDSGGEGIDLNSVTGEARIERNQILVSGNQGINIFSETGTLNLVIANNTISDGDDDGIYIYTEGDAVINATVSSNTISNNNGFGIYLDSYDSSQLTATIHNRNIFTENGTYALNGESYDSSTQKVTIDNNQIGPNNSEGMEFLSSDDSTQEVIITNNNIDNNTSFGIFLSSQDNSHQIVTIDSNPSISGAGGSSYGILIGSRDDSRQEVTITNNLKIEGNGGDGIYIESGDNSHQIVTIDSNPSISGNNGNGILIAAYGDSTQEVTITNNPKIEGNNGSGLYLESYSNAVQTLNITGNTFAGNGAKDVFGEFDSSKSVCLNLAGNSSNSGGFTGYQFDITGANLQFAGGLAAANSSNTPNGTVTATAGKVDNACTP